MNTQSKLRFAEDGVARYHQLATLFRQKISSREWTAGEQIPTVMDLSRQFGVSTMTIRQAVGILESEGLVERFRAKGTFVRKDSPPALWCEVQTDWSGLLQMREGANIRVVSKGRAKIPDTAARFGKLAPSYFRLERHHSRGDAVFLLSDVYIAADLAKNIPPRKFATSTSINLVAEIEGIEIAEARQTLTIEQADLEVSARLDIPLNAPIARVLRVVADGEGTLILFAEGIYRGDWVRLDMKLLDAGSASEEA